MLIPTNHLIIKVCNQLPSSSMKTLPNLLEEPWFYFYECAQNQPVKQILPKTSPDNCDVQVFERVDEATKN